MILVVLGCIENCFISSGYSLLIRIVDSISSVVVIVGIFKLCKKIVVKNDIVYNIVIVISISLVGSLVWILV